MTEQKLTLEQLEKIQPICIFDNRTTNAEYTVIIPTFCRSSLLQYALKSAMEQEGTYSYDIIIMDNNPERNDETEEFMTRFQHVDKLAYYKEPRNIGGTGNWNKATQMAKTKWVVMLHDDDMLYPDYFRVLEKARQCKLNADAIYSDCQHHYFSDDKLLPRLSSTPQIWHIKEQDFLLSNIAGPLVGMAYKKAAWEMIGGFDYDYSPLGDYFFHSRLAHYGKIYKIKNYPTTCYRWFDNDTTRQGVAEAIVRQAYNIKMFIMSSLKFVMPLSWQQRLCSIPAYMTLSKWKLSTQDYQTPSKNAIHIYILWVRLMRIPMKIRRDILSKTL